MRRSRSDEAVAIKERPLKKQRLDRERVTIDSLLVRFMVELTEVFRCTIVEEWEACGTFLPTVWALGLVSKDVRRSIANFFGGSADLTRILHDRAKNSNFKLFNIVSEKIKEKYYVEGCPVSLFEIDAAYDADDGSRYEKFAPHHYALYQDRANKLFGWFYDHDEETGEQTRKLVNWKLNYGDPSRKVEQRYLVNGEIEIVSANRRKTRQPEALKHRSNLKILIKTFELAVGTGFSCEFLRDMYDGSVEQCMNFNLFNMDSCAGRVLMACFLNDEQSLPLDIFERLLSFQEFKHFNTMHDMSYASDLQDGDVRENVTTCDKLFANDHYGYLEYHHDCQDGFIIVPSVYFGPDKPDYHRAMIKEFNFRINYMMRSTKINKAMEDSEPRDTTLGVDGNEVVERYYNALEELNEKHGRSFNYISLE